MRLRNHGTQILHSHRTVPLLLIIVVPFIFLILVAVGLTGWVSFHNGQKTVNTLAVKLRTEVSERIKQHLHTYLEKPHLITQTNTNAAQLEKLNLKDKLALEQHFALQLQLFNSVSQIYVGFPDGISVLAGLQDNDKLIAKTTTTFPERGFYTLSSQGDRLHQFFRDPLFDPRLRPWYEAAVKAQKPTWSDIYTFAQGEIGITASQPFYDPSGKLRGVMAVDLVLGSISNFLRGLKISPHAQTLIIERSGLIVASSTSDQPYTILGRDRNYKAHIRRLQSLDSSDALTRGTVQYLNAYFGGLRQIANTQQLDFVVDGKRHFLQVLPYQDPYGLDWLAIVVIPEDDFMAEINANTRTALLLCLASLGIAIAIGILTSRWIASPITRLSFASRELAKLFESEKYHESELDQQADSIGVNELEVLAEAFNQMAQKLRQSFTALEETNTQLEQRVEQRTAELRASEARFRGILDHAADALVVHDLEGKITHVNQHTSDYFGYTQSELLNLTVFDLEVNADIEDLKNNWRQMVGGSATTIQGLNRRHNGTTFPVEVRIGLFELGEQPLIIALVRDITERKLAEDAIRRSNSLLNAQKEAAIDGILAVDEQGRIVSYNHRFCEMWNISETELISSDENRLLVALLYKLNMPEELIAVVERAYDQLNEKSRDQIHLGDGRVFDFYSSPVMSDDVNFYGVIWYFRDVTDRVKAEIALHIEKEKSERLLLNVLPQRIAKRLIQSTQPIADRFEDVSILFADIVDFTPMAAIMHPTDLVYLLNQIFSKFDQLAEEYNLEKIKTIGDGYMAVGGIPIVRTDHAEAIADMALRMQVEIAQFLREDGKPFSLRIGINTGAVVAGVIGIKKFIYDLWGDTVNVAARMESQGEMGKIQVTEATYARLKDNYMLEERGMVTVKGKGEMITYWLIGKKDRL